MAENDIYNSKEKYERFVANYRDLAKPSTDKKRLYGCKNSINLKYFEKLFDYFNSKDQSYIRRLRLLLTFKIIVHAAYKDLKDCDRPDIDKIVAFMHTAYKSPKSKRDFITDIKHLWKVLFPEKDERGRIDETLTPYPVKHLSGKQDKSTEKSRNDKLTLEEFETLVQSFSQDIRLQAYLTLAWESLGRPQEILYTKISDVELHDNYAKIHVSEHGKEGTKFLMCIDSYPYLVRWYDKHPLRKNTKSFLFINLGDTNRYQQLRPATINKHIRQKLAALNIKKQITCYSLKRFGVTYKRLRGDSDASIQHTAGWTSNNQLKTYDRSEQEDTFNIELAKRGLIKDPKYKEFAPTTKKCLFCNHINGMADLICKNCNRPLDREEIIKEEHNRDKAIEELKKQLNELSKAMTDNIKKQPQIDLADKEQLKLLIKALRIKKNK